MLEEGSGLEDILRMEPESVLDRRLQTQVYLQGLASTVKQARQLIIHGHISVDGAVNRVPGMIVTKLQEKEIRYSPLSALNSDLHPVRPGNTDVYGSETTQDEVEVAEEENTEEAENTSEESDAKAEEPVENEKEAEK